MNDEIKKALEELDLKVGDNYVVIIENGFIHVEDVTSNDIFEVKFELGVL